MKEGFPWFKFYPASYLAKTRRMTDEEVRRYMDDLAIAWIEATPESPPVGELAEVWAAISAEREANRRGGQARSQVATRSPGGRFQVVSQRAPGTQTQTQTHTQKKRERVRRLNSRLPPDFVLNEKLSEFGSKRGMNERTLSLEFDAFCSWHESKGSTFESWDAAWRTWVLRWEKDPKRKIEIDPDEFARQVAEEVRKEHGVH